MIMRLLIIVPLIIRNIIGSLLNERIFNGGGEVFRLFYRGKKLGFEVCCSEAFVSMHIISNAPFTIDNPIRNTILTHRGALEYNCRFSQ